MHLDHGTVANLVAVAVGVVVLAMIVVYEWHQDLDDPE